MKLIEMPRSAAPSATRRRRSSAVWRTDSRWTAASSAPPGVAASLKTNGATNTAVTLAPCLRARPAAYHAARSEVVESSTPTRISLGPSVPSSNSPAATSPTTAVYGPSRCGRPSAYNRPKGDFMDDVAGQFLDAIHRLEDVRDAITPQRANAEFDEITLQVFWKKWPHLSAWAGSLWRMLSEELADPSSPHLDAELDEVGGSE